jgi:hypothetical protein
VREIHSSKKCKSLFIRKHIVHILLRQEEIRSDGSRDIDRGQRVHLASENNVEKQTNGIHRNKVKTPKLNEIDLHLASDGSILTPLHHPSREKILKEVSKKVNKFNEKRLDFFIFYIRTSLLVIL